MMRLSLLSLLLAAPLAAAPRLDRHGDPLPDGAITRFGTVRYRIGLVGDHDLAPDGTVLAVGGPFAIQLWDTGTGRPLHRLPIEDGRYAPDSLTRLRFSPDGKHVACATPFHLYVWEVATGKLRHRTKIESPIQWIGFNPEGDRVVGTAAGSEAAFFDVATGRPAGVLRGETSMYGLTRSGRSFLGGDFAEPKFLVDARTGHLRARFAGTAGLDRSLLTVSPDDQRVYAAAPNGRVRVFDAADGKLVREIDPPPGTGPRDARGLIPSPDGRTLYMPRGEKSLARWDVTRGQWLEPLTGVSWGYPLPHPNGKELLVLDLDGLLRRWDLTTGREVPPPDGFAGSVSAAPSPDGRRVAVAASNRVALFDRDGKPVWTVAGHAARPDLRWAPGGTHLVASNGTDLVVRDAGTGDRVRGFKTVGPNGWERDLFAFAAGGKWLLAADPNTWELTGFDWRTGDLAPVPKARVGAGADLAPDGRTLATGGPDFRVLDMTTGAVLGATHELPSDCIRYASHKVLFSPDGVYLLSWDERGVAVLRDPATAERRREIRTGQLAVWGFAFSPGGQWLAAGGEDGTLTIWDVPSGTKVLTRSGHRGTIRHVEFVGSGQVLTSSDDLTVLLWDLKPDEKPTRPLWEALSGSDAGEAYRAVWALATDPAGPEILRARVIPAKGPSAGQMRQWLADLAADKYPVREAATQALQKLGRLAEPDLRAAREKATSAEARLRLDVLLAKVPRERTAAEAIEARAVLAMELAGTDAAKKVLVEWAAGAPGARLTQDAKAALGRFGPK